MKLKGSKTEKNLLKSFAGESQARNRYTYFASVARKEGYEQISSIFLETADNEKEHAKIFFSFLEGNNVEITAEYPAGKIRNTKENLLAAEEGEKIENTKIYPDFEKTARKEGFNKIADSFKEISDIEETHKNRYNKLLENLKTNKVFKRNNIVKWKCRNCGYIHKGKSAPEKCPACEHPKAFYELFVENY